MHAKTANIAKLSDPDENIKCLVFVLTEVTLPKGWHKISGFAGNPGDQKAWILKILADIFLDQIQDILSDNGLKLAF